DNERSYAPTIGGLAHHLSTLRTTRGYERFLDWGREVLQRGGAPGRLAFEALHGVKKGIKDVVAPQGMFEDLGIKYLGPVDGHDIGALEHALGRPKPFGARDLGQVTPRRARGSGRPGNAERTPSPGIATLDPEPGVRSRQP